MKTFIFTAIVATFVLFSACTGKKAQNQEMPAADSVSKMMITAKVFLKPEFVTPFIDGARAMIDSSNMEPGCESYMLYQDPYDSTKLIFVEVWKDQAAIDNHFSMSYFKAWGPKTQDWLAQPTELKIVKVIE
jgi:quinol monooxygenase YgiN